MSTPVISTDSWSGNGASDQPSTNDSSPGRALHIPPNQSEICISPFSDPPPPTTCMGEGRWCVMQYHAGYIRSVLHSRHQSLNPPPPHLSFKYFRPGKRWHLFKSVESARGAFVFAIEIRTARSL